MSRRPPKLKDVPLYCPYCRATYTGGGCYNCGTSVHAGKGDRSILCHKREDAWRKLLEARNEMSLR